MDFNPDVLSYEVAKAFGKAKTEEEVDRAWKELVSPYYFAIPKEVLHVLEQLHSLTLTVLRGGLRK